MMVNVDQCTRWAERGLCGEARKYAGKIARLPKENKVKIFKNKNAAAVEEILERDATYIKEEVAKSFGVDKVVLKHSSDDNKQGADLFATLPDGSRVDIEVKFGNKTDHALGMEELERILGTTTLSEALSLKNRCDWQKKLIREWPNKSGQAERLKEALNDFVNDYNNELAGRKYKLTKTQGDALEKLVLNNSGAAGNNKDSRHYMIFERKRGELVAMPPFATGVGCWEVLPIRKIGELGENGKKLNRVTIFIVNRKSKLKIRCVVNFKNNKFVRELGVKVPAKLGLNSPSANVWIVDYTPE